MMRVLKWTVPVDDQWHPIGAGDVVHVACQMDGPFSVQVWTLEADNLEMRSACVFGTGQPLPDRVTHLGTALANQGALVWHLFGGISDAS